MLKIFLTYKNEGDYLNYFEYLEKLLKSYDNLEEKLQHEFYLADFLKELLNELKNENINSNLTKLFNLIDYSIDVTTHYEYIYDVPNVLVLLLEELSLKGIEGVSVLANTICRTKGLIQYSNLFSKFISD